MRELVRLEPAWSDERSQAVWRGLLRRRRSRRVARASLALLLLAFVCGAVWLRLVEQRVVRFADGSTARLLDEGSVVEKGASAKEVVTARLQRGRARFEVVRDPARRFRVEADEVAVEVLGTVFTVEKSGARARVAVEEGRVRVSWARGAVELGPGESGLFPPADEVAALLSAADRARAIGRVDEAIAPLRRVIDAHADDPRAPLAAFTLGKLLDELGRRREAAGAFARARTLAPDGPLSHDAKQREAQARGAR